MNLLLDTHVFLWFCQDDPALSAAAKTLIEDPSNRKLVSVASCGEVAIKAGLQWGRNAGYLKDSPKRRNGFSRS